ncbi:hypothetical protein FUAX_18430 [Fulvitalea axinellae]|uniref:IraD/Gp25-like domain-containing protein n=1 Tax=Fulvitalea axinellae TaxID=1182444 RepID=A0AAU9CB64_9BACT|nr:hypothetical protein FUAX_18430 [Fulvitalea axinellae]
MKDEAFLGKGWGFPPRFDAVNRGAVMVDKREDIEESIGILLNTYPGERVMNPEYGCKLFRYVNEVISESLFTEIRETVRWAIIDFEPRVLVVDISLDYDPSDAVGLIRINILYEIKETNTRHNMVYPYYLLEGSNL